MKPLSDAAGQAVPRPQFEEDLSTIEQARLLSLKRDCQICMQRFRDRQKDLNKFYKHIINSIAFNLAADPLNRPNKDSQSLALGSMNNENSRASGLLEADEDQKKQIVVTSPE